MVPQGLLLPPDIPSVSAQDSLFLLFCGQGTGVKQHQASWQTGLSVYPLSCPTEVMPPRPGQVLCAALPTARPIPFILLALEFRLQVWLYT